MTEPLVREPEQNEAWRPPRDPGLVMGRPVEDRAFEAVEAGAGLAVGIAIGAAVAGPIGAAVGAAIGVVGGLTAGEFVERHAGRAATTTDATGPDRESLRPR